MASRVPTAQQFRVGPEGGTPFVDGGPAQSSAGKQLMQAGDALSDAGSAASAIFLDQQRELNKTRVEEATLKAMTAADRLTYSEEEGYANIKGGDAVNREKPMSDEWGGYLDDTMQKIEATLGNDAQRREFQRVASRMSQGFRGKLEEHVAGEAKTYQVSVATGKIGVLTRELTLSGDRPERMGGLIEGIEGATRDIMRLSGRTDANDVTVQTQIEVGKAMKTSMSYLLDNGDTQLAEAMFDNFASRADADSRHDMSLALRQQQRSDDANALAGEAADLMYGGGASGAPSDDHDLGLPIAGMSYGNATGKFGDQRPGHKHAGIDIPGKAGTPILATGDGTVKLKTDPKGYGYYVEIDHGGGTVTRYAHLEALPTDLKDGQRVRRGQVVGKMGSTGRSTGPHLHYEVRVNDTAVDPRKDYRVKGGQGAGGSEAEAIDFIYKNAKDPRTAEMAVGKFRERSAAFERDKARQREDDVGTAELAIIQGKDPPPSVMARLRPGDKADVLQYREQVRKQRAAGQPDAKSQVWATTLQGIVAGQITTPQQLSRYAPFMDPSDYRHLEGMLKGDKSGQKNVFSQAFTTLGRVDSTLKQLGIDEKSNPDEYNAFKRKFLADVQELSERRKDPPTDEELYGRAIGLLGTDTRGGRGYQQQRVKYRYNAIPQGIRSQIENSLIAKGYKRSSPNWQSWVENTYYQM